MYQSPSSTSSSSQNSVVPGGLTRYGSAPGSFLNSAIDSIIASTHGYSAAVGSPPNYPGHYFPSAGDDSSTSSLNKSDTNCKVSLSNDPKDLGGPLLQRSYGFREISQRGSGAPAAEPSSLVRQRSSPAGFLTHLSSDQKGFSITRGFGSQGASRLKSQRSFTGQETLGRISEVNESDIDGMAQSSGHQNANLSYSTSGFAMEWDGSTSIAFSTQPNKRANKLEGDFLTCLDTQFSLPQTTLEMARMEHYMQIPEDSVPCKVRAKRGCATHPRSIAERERRTRISGKLKKLQELVPNMDKQTSYADMLELAVEHIKGLQNQVQKLQKEQENCACGCRTSE